jgi:hypothetical protein
VGLGDFYDERLKDSRKAAQQESRNIKYPVATLLDDGNTFELGGRTFSIPDEML